MSTQQPLALIESVFRYDPHASKVIKAAKSAFIRYIDAREHHIDLMRAPRDEYDPNAVRSADTMRSGLHNEAISAMIALRGLQDAAGVNLGIPSIPEDDTAFKAPWRDVIARFAYDVANIDYRS